MIATSREAGDDLFQQIVDIDPADKNSHSLDDCTPRYKDDERRDTGPTTGDVVLWL